MKVVPVMIGLVLMYTGYLLLDTDIVNQSVGVLEEESMEVSITKSDGNIQLDLEEYVVQVVGSEMPASFDMEALKAQAVASRTYVMSRNLKVDDSTKTQVYQSDEQFRKKWGNDYDMYITKIREAVYDTKGLVMKYDNKIVRALFYSCSNGHTANSSEYYSSQFPYLVSVESKYDIEVNKNFEKNVDINKDFIIEQLGSWDIEVLSWYDSGYVKEVRVGNKKMSGKDVREKLGLRSSCFEVLTKENSLTFITYGSGHGVGMSQYGAHGMALHGYTFDEILKHYYQGVDIVSIYE